MKNRKMFWKSLMGCLLGCFILILAPLVSLPAAPGTAEGAGDTPHVRHALKVGLFPKAHRLTARDRVEVPDRLKGELRFSLHRGLEPSSPTPGVKIVKEGRGNKGVLFETFRITFPAGLSTFVLNYGGSIFHPVDAYGKEQARGFRQTPGLISEAGVYLSGSSFWYPQFEGELVTFSLEVELPGDWKAVSQGERTRSVQRGDRTSVLWESPEPQDEIFLVAAPFTEYRGPAGRIEAMVFLRRPDDRLANKYLDATARYLAMYEALLGPYPYRKFALVENFWETGFGMPSFTLLGPKVIRFPFILHSSYPHEILHNWWGNGVFPDYQGGNWAEGLTAYLSDHLIKEQRGKGVDYRQSTLQKYADYVRGGRDFPLIRFRSRHSASSEAVGYGKSLMFFHMLRQGLGDETFIRGLRDFYQKKRFRFASFEDLRKSFEATSGRDLKREFDQWITRTGAPEIRVSGARVRTQGTGYLLTATLEQVQPEGLYHLSVPVAVTTQNETLAYQSVVDMGKRTMELRVQVPSRPLRLDVDPEFDLFRRLGRDEIPPALSQAFGAKKMLILLPSSADRKLLEAYRGLSRALGQSGPDLVEVKLDREIKEIPTDRAVIIIGWENRFLNEIVTSLDPYDVNIHQGGVGIGRTEIPRARHSLVLTSRHPDNKDASLTFIASDLPGALPGLGRKLPHYHKYSYLGFEGEEPANVARGRWPVLDSPMTVFVPRDDGSIPMVEMGGLSKREPLANFPQAFSTERMMDVIRFLTRENLEGRGYGTAGLEKSAEFIAGKFQEAGLVPAGGQGTGYFQIWEEQEGDPERKVMLKNVIGVIPGTRPELRSQSVVVGAHYDHLGIGRHQVREEKHRGKTHPGADDNGSGVAVLLELARVLGRDLRPRRSVVFVAFTGEEVGKKGSRYYVANFGHYPPHQAIGMLNLDTVGRLGKRKLLVLGAGSAREWVHIFRGAGYVTGVDLEMVPEALDSSDQKTFQEAGIPAVQLFSGPHLDYHRPTDTAEKIDPEGLLKVASVAKEVVAYLAERETPLTTSLTPSGGRQPPTRRTRKVSLGTIPDFAFKGEGYRLSDVVPGSPAEASGLQKGDVIVRIGTNSVSGLREFSNLLKALNPGDRVSITFLRAREEKTLEVELVGR